MNYYVGDIPPYYTWQQPYGWWQYQQPYTYQAPRLGWECPKCHACYNPDIHQCLHCGSNKISTDPQITWSTNTEDALQVNDG